MFRDRVEAGRALAAAVTVTAPERPVVLALPRGGVPVAAEVARALDAPLGLLVVRKLGVPGDEELAAGAVGDGDPPVTVFNPDVLRMIGMREEDFAARVRTAVGELRERRRRWLGDRPPPDVRGRTAVVVDDGIATGATVRAGLRVLRAREPARIVLAVPVAPADTLSLLASDADEIVCLHAPRHFSAVGSYYAHFPQTSDAEVAALLREADERTGGRTAP